MGCPADAREDWTKGLDLPVPRVGEVEQFEYLFSVGCADLRGHAKKTTRAVATLLNEAGVTFAILGNNETCTGDPALLMAMIRLPCWAMQNVRP